MDIKEVDLRRSDFEAMYPVAKLFNFDHEKLTYFGDGYDDAKRLNDLWSTWCACVGLLYLEANTAKAQAVPEGYVVVPMEPTEQILNRMTNAPIEVNHLCDNADIFLSEDEARIAYKAMIEAQEPTND